jgi:hypothetical protein
MKRLKYGDFRVWHVMVSPVLEGIKDVGHYWTKV